jgi:TetR/AcrR family transcriptional regulator, cholesterol catabolism regulator
VPPGAVAPSDGPISWMQRVDDMVRETKNSVKKKAHIAKAGAELFSKKGFAETSMEDISAVAKLSKGGIYHYFSSKTDILFFVLDSFMDLVLDGLEEEMGSLDSGIEKVRRLIFRHVELYPKHMAEARALFHEVQNLTSRDSRKIINKEREYYRITSDVLTEYFGTALDKEQITATTFILLGMCNSIYGWYNPKSAIAPDRLSQTIFEVIINGLSGIQKEATGIQPS